MLPWKNASLLICPSTFHTNLQQHHQQPSDTSQWSLWHLSISDAVWGHCTACPLQKGERGTAQAALKQLMLWLLFNVSLQFYPDHRKGGGHGFSWQKARLWEACWSPLASMPAFGPSCPLARWTQLGSQLCLGSSPCLRNHSSLLPRPGVSWAGQEGVMLMRSLPQITCGGCREWIFFWLNPTSTLHFQLEFPLGVFSSAP